MQTNRIIDAIMEGTDVIGTKFRSTPRERAWTVVALGQRDDGKKTLTMERAESKTILETTFRQHYYMVGGDKDLRLVAEFKRFNYQTVEA